MPIPASVESLDKVPEALRGEYEPRDGKFFLKLDGEPAGFVPKARLDEFRNNNVALTKERDELKGIAEKYKDIDPDRAREALERLQDIEDKKLLAAGKVDELVQARIEKLVGEKDGRINELAAALDKEKQRNQGLDAELSQVLIKDKIKSKALDNHAVKPTALHFLTLLAEHGDEKGVRWTLDENRLPVAVKADGQKAWSGKDANKPLDMDEWIDDAIKANPEIRKPSSGGGAIPNTAGGGSKTDISGLLPAEKLKVLRRQGHAAA